MLFAYSVEYGRDMFLSNVRWPITFTRMMEATLSSETSVLTGATWRHIPADSILHYVPLRIQYLSPRFTGVLHNLYKFLTDK
jgi:hypothetical protein